MRSVGNHHKDRQGARSLDHHVEQLQRRGVGPVQVFIELEHGPLAGEPGQLLDQDLEGALLLALRTKVRGRVALISGHAHQRPDQRRRLVQLLGALSEHRLELGEPVRGFVTGGEARRPLELRDDRVEHTIGVVGRAEIAQCEVRLIGQLLTEGVQQPRLADARLARNQDDLAVAVLGPAPALHEHGQLVLTSDQRRQALPMEGFEAAIGGAFALNPEGGDRLCEALDQDWSEVGQLEQTADQPLGRLADDDAAGLGQRLQAGRKVRRLADHGALARVALAHRLADHHEPGRDPDPGGEPTVGHLERAHGLDEGEGRPHRPLSVVLMRLRPAEIGQHAVAHELGDVAFEPQGLAGHGILVDANCRAHLLGIERRRQRGRADKIDKHHRQLAPLGCRRPRRQRSLGWGGAQSRSRSQSRVGQRGDRFQKLAAVPDDGDANVLQVIGGQLGQNVGSDLILPERLPVALQPQLSQPRQDIHGVPQLGNQPAALTLSERRSAHHHC